MDMDLTGLNIPDYIKSENTGWLDPDGTFHSCDYTDHLDVAYELYGTYNYEELARRGIVHVFWNPTRNMTDYYIAVSLTDAQISWLEQHNISIYDEDRGRI